MFFHFNLNVFHLDVMNKNKQTNKNKQKQNKTKTKQTKTTTTSVAKPNFHIKCGYRGNHIEAI